MDADDGSAREAWTPIAEAGIDCFLCPRTAGQIAVQRRGDDIQVVRRSFTGTLTRPVSGDLSRNLVEVLAGDAAAARLFVLDAELAPFFCPRCRTSFCGIHWTVEVVHDDELENWVDSIRGRCPFDHERMLED